ncbi:MAG: hypothetical protein JJU11_08330 [Candidatus Sumerlaeia bacterium]|nr:hypothetical protein [Candidatus Sumerlaeia bacterium]
MSTPREENKAEGAIEDAKETAADAKDAVEDGFETAKVKVAEGYEKVSEKAHKAWDKAADTTIHDVEHSATVFIRKNPGKSLLFAATAGLVIGAIFRGRFS